MAMKKVPAKKKKSLGQLPKAVRNKMGYAKKGAKVVKAKKGAKITKKKMVKKKY